MDLLSIIKSFLSSKNKLDKDKNICSINDILGIDVYVKYLITADSPGNMCIYNLNDIKLNMGSLSQKSIVKILDIVRSDNNKNDLYSFLNMISINLNVMYGNYSDIYINHDLKDIFNTIYLNSARIQLQNGVINYSSCNNNELKRYYNFKSYNGSIVTEDMEFIVVLDDLNYEKQYMIAEMELEKVNHINTSFVPKIITFKEYNVIKYCMDSLI